MEANNLNAARQQKDLKSTCLSNASSIVIHDLNGTVRQWPATGEVIESFLSVECAMRALDLSRATLYAHLNSGRIKSTKIGCRRLIPASELRRLAAEAA